MKCYSLPKVRSAPRKLVMLFHLRYSHMVGEEGGEICSYLLVTPQSTLGGSQAVKQRNVLHLAVNSSLFLALVWDTSRPSRRSQIPDRATSSSCHPPPGYTLPCSPSTSADHSSLLCLKHAISISEHLQFPLLITAPPRPLSRPDVQYILVEAFVIPLN